MLKLRVSGLGLGVEGFEFGIQDLGKIRLEECRVGD